MTTTNTAVPRITRTELPNGKFRYEVDGRVHTKASNRRYTHASLYTNPAGEPCAFLHTRQDLAIKGDPQFNRLAAQGFEQIRRLGWTEIVEEA